MLNARRANRGFGSRGGMGFGFRGSSPPWPYVGRGKGELPKCGYFLNATASAPSASQMSREQELAMLNDQGQERLGNSLKKMGILILSLSSSDQSSPFQPTTYHL